MNNLTMKKEYIKKLNYERDLMVIFNYETNLSLKLFIIREKKLSQKCLLNIIFEEENEKIKSAVVSEVMQQN